MRSGVARVCLATGFNDVHMATDETFTDITCQFVSVLMRTAAEFAANSGRTEATVDDISRALLVVYGKSEATRSLTAYISDVATTS